MQSNEGIVIEVKGDIARVKVARHGECKNCGSCPGDQSIILNVLNPINATEGQHVIFKVKEENMLKAAFIVYILPLIGIFLGAAAGGWISSQLNFSRQLFQIFGGAVALILSIIYIKHYEKTSRKNIKILPIITNIIS